MEVAEEEEEKAIHEESEEASASDKEQPNDEEKDTMEDLLEPNHYGQALMIGKSMGKNSDSPQFQDLLKRARKDPTYTLVI